MAGEKLAREYHFLWFCGIRHPARIGHDGKRSRGRGSTGKPGSHDRHVAPGRNENAFTPHRGLHGCDDRATLSPTRSAPSSSALIDGCPPPPPHSKVNLCSFKNQFILKIPPPRRQESNWRSIRERLVGDERARACTSAFKMHGMTNCNSRELKNSEEGAGGTSGAGREGQRTQTSIWL